MVDAARSLFVVTGRRLGRKNQVAIRFSDPEMRKLRAMAKTHNLSVSDLIRVAIANFPDQR